MIKKWIKDKLIAFLEIEDIKEQIEQNKKNTDAMFKYYEEINYEKRIY